MTVGALELLGAFATHEGKSGRDQAMCHRVARGLELDPCEGLHGKSWRFIVELNNNFEIVGMIIILFFLWPSWKSGHDLVA